MAKGGFFSDSDHGDAVEMARAARSAAEAHPSHVVRYGDCVNCEARGEKLKEPCPNASEEEKGK